MEQIKRFFRRYPEEQKLLYFYSMLRNYNLVFIGDSNDAVGNTYRNCVVNLYLEFSCLMVWKKYEERELVTSIENVKQDILEER